ncbi:MAG: MFS transporter [Ignavibacteriae bacterium]|nr:MFS transporter [Ignavibacteriota bacterium]
MSNSKKNNKLFNINYILLWQGQFISRIGSQIYFIAMVLWVKDATDSASLLGLMGFITGVPAVIFSVIGGTFADRHSRKKIIVYSDLLSGVLMIILALLFYFANNFSLNLVIAFLLFTSSATSIISSYFIPAISAAIPDIVPKNKLASANSWSQSSHQFVAIFGLALGGLLFTLVGAPLLVLINGITFVFSAISEMFIKIPQNIPKKKESWVEKYKDFKDETIDGYRYIFENSGLKKMVLSSVMINFFSTPIILLLPFFVDLFLHLDDSWLGYLLAISSVGTLLGLMSAGLFEIVPKKRVIIVLFFILISGVFDIFIGIFHTLIPVVILMFLSGFTTGYIQVHISTILQTSTPSEKRGRVFGFLGTLTGALIPLGMGVGGFIADMTNKNIPLIYIVCGVLITVLSIYLINSPDVKSFLSIDYEGSNEIGEKTEIKEEESQID